MKRLFLAKLSWLLIILVCAMTLTVYSGTPNAPEDTDNATVSEGTDTVCEITGYHDYTGPFSSYFLKEGDTIAVISPSALPSKEQYEATMKGLKEWGYRPVAGKYVCVEERTLENCLEDLEWALTDPSVKAIFCVRGGYASTEVMDILPEDLITSSKKPIIGFSDITIYHSAWVAAGLLSIHASMSEAFMDLPEDCTEAEQHLIQGQIPEYKCAASGYDRQGSAEGILIGGNLSTLTAAVATAYDCTETGQPYILFLEEVEEDYEHIHRYLTVLEHMGILDRASGVIFGEWVDLPAFCETYSGNSRGGTFRSVADMISREFFQDSDIPIAFGFPAGHAQRNYPLLMGEQAHLVVADDHYTLGWE